MKVDVKNVLTIAMIHLKHLFSSPAFRGHINEQHIFKNEGLPPWLLPLNLPDFHENLEDTLYNQRKLRNDYYKNALKHLRVALYSTPPVIEAFHPLIQMLLLGDLVREAFDELEKFQVSDTGLHSRLKAALVEHFYGINNVELSACFEDILRNDPTCCNSLTRLIVMRQQGACSADKLAEMISLHLDATYAKSDVWKELASCFLSLCHCGEDRVSAESRKEWRLRCRWWLGRHFSHNITSDIASGELELLTYKAAAASHLYGREMKYVMKTAECLEKENNMELYAFLQRHILNSIGFYTSAKRNNLL